MCWIYNLFTSKSKWQQIQIKGKLHTGLGCGRKLLTLEMLHMPSRYCWAWMVTELSDPVSCAPATVTWTLALDPTEDEGPGDQPGTLCRSPKGTREGPIAWLLDSCLEVDTVILEGCGRKDAVDRAAMSELKFSTGACSVWRASCLSWWRGVEHTWQLLTLPLLLPEDWSCSNRNAAYPGSCRVNTQDTEALITYTICPYSTSQAYYQPICFFQRISLMLLTFFMHASGLQACVVPDCPLWPLLLLNRSFRFGTVVCLDWAASPACNLKFHKACARCLLETKQALSTT